VPTSAALRLWAPVVLWAAVIFTFSSVPDLGTGLGTWDLVLRKIAHACEYAVLGALLLRAVRAELRAESRELGARCVRAAARRIRNLCANIFHRLLGIP